MGRNTIYKNIFHLFYSTILANVLNASTLILLANYFNAKNYGVFSVALAFSMVMHFFTDLGVSNTFLREGSKKEQVHAKFSSYIKVRIVCLFFTILIFGVAIQILYKDQQIIYMIYSLIFPMVIGLTFQTIGITYFQLTEKMQFIALIKIFSAIVLVASVILCMQFEVNVHFSAFAYGVSYLCGGIYSLFLLFQKGSIIWKSSFQKQLLNKLGPFFISGLFIMFTPQLGPLVLEKTLTFPLVGLFAVAFRIPSALYQIPGVVAGAFFPLLLKHYNQGEVEEHTRLHILQLKLMSFISMWITIFLFYSAGYLVSILFGNTWGDAVQPLKVLAFIIVLQGFNIAAADYLTTRGMQSFRTTVQFISILVGIVSLYYLSIHYAIMGAVSAIVLMETTSFFGYILANPARREAMTKVVIPYGLNFSVGFILIYYFLHMYPFIAILVTVLLITVVILLFDQQVKKLIVDRVKRMQKMKHETNGG